MAKRDRVLSGMRPSGRLHLGNYLGALANWVNLQDSMECFYFVADFLQRTNRYTTLAADEWVRAGHGIGPRDLVLRPLGRFLSMYVVHAGWRDGWRGFLLAVLYAYYVFVRSAKVWERVKR